MWGQILLEENFNYTTGTKLTDNGWTVFNVNSANSIVVESSSLTFSDYPSSGIGGSVIVDADGEDVYSSLNISQTSGIIYVSLLVNASNATTGAGDYFFGMGSTKAGTLAGRLYIKKSSGNLAFGISKTSGDTSFTSFDYLFNTTYLIVIKYTINSGASNDDVALFVISGAIPSSEPTPTIIHPTEATSDPSNISVVALRQNSTTNIVAIDGIRVGTTWNDAPLPVELTSFTASPAANKVLLAWSTATETQNAGFEIQRKLVHPAAVSIGKTVKLCSDWTKIGFVEGTGTTSSPRSYSFTDPMQEAGIYAYRLKQINRDGSFKIYSETEVQIALSPEQYTLSQNYPNPFNPATALSFAVHTPQHVSVKVYNMLGQEVAVLFDGIAQADLNYKLTFDGTNLSSGMYFSVMKSGNAAASIKRMILMK